MLEKKVFEVGGLKVTRNVEKAEIDRFIAGLSVERKKDIKDVLAALHEEGLITIEEKVH